MAETVFYSLAYTEPKPSLPNMGGRTFYMGFSKLFSEKERGKNQENDR